MARLRRHCSRRRGRRCGNAYAPYSQFPVGAAIRTDGRPGLRRLQYRDRAYPEGWCAETVGDRRT